MLCVPTKEPKMFNSDTFPVIKLINFFKILPKMFNSDTFPVIKLINFFKILRKASDISKCWIKSCGPQTVLI